MAEAVVMRLARDLGKPAAHALVETASRRAAADRRSLAEVLAEDASVTAVIDRREIERTLAPENYLGAARAMTTQALADRQSRKNVDDRDRGRRLHACLQRRGSSRPSLPASLQLARHDQGHVGGSNAGPDIRVPCHSLRHTRARTVGRAARRVCDRSTRPRCPCRARRCRRSARARLRTVTRGDQGMWLGVHAADRVDSLVLASRPPGSELWRCGTSASGKCSTVARHRSLMR